MNILYLCRPGLTYETHQHQDQLSKSLAVKFSSCQKWLPRELTFQRLPLMVVIALF
ncbi:hypothetical protein DsansV1_C04g0050141 [Dioscorea sansibarensis]